MILITRPEPKASELSALLNADDIKNWVYPTIEIKPPVDLSWQSTLREQVKPEDMLIFVSQHAVTQTNFPSPLAGEVNIRTLTCIAIGKGTAQALKNAGFTNIHCTDQMANSESALALPLLQNVQGKTIWILRGNGGRELIHDTLIQRGAIVKVLTCYERHLPTQPIQPVIEQWKNTGFECVICTSLEGLQNLWHLLGSAYLFLLQNTPITVLSESMLRWAKAQGIKHTYFLPSAHNHDILHWLQDHYDSRNSL